MFFSNPNLVNSNQQAFFANAQVITKCLPPVAQLSRNFDRYSRTVQITDIWLSRQNWKLRAVGYQTLHSKINTEYNLGISVLNIRLKNQSPQIPPTPFNGPSDARFCTLPSSTGLQGRNLGTTHQRSEIYVDWTAIFVTSACLKTTQKGPSFRNCGFNCASGIGDVPLKHGFHPEEPIRKQNSQLWASEFILS